MHRDVKPGNVLLARQRGSEAGEHVYLSDFGLTKRSASDSGITGTGQFVGTLDYAAPEQFKGGTPDARTDVYSLGCVLFECLTGQPPFTSENDAGLMYAHLQEPPPSVTAIDPSCRARSTGRGEGDGEGTRGIGSRAAGALADEAARALGVGAEMPRPTRSRRPIRRLAPALAVAIALVAGVVAASARAERATPAAAARAPSAPPAIAEPDPGTPPSGPSSVPSIRTRSDCSPTSPQDVSVRVPAARSRPSRSRASSRPSCAVPATSRCSTSCSRPGTR